MSYAQWTDPRKWLSIKTRRRVQWVHSDVRCDHKASYFKRLMKERKQFDRFVLVSNEAKNNFDSFFKKAKDKEETIFNIVDNKEIKRLALEKDVSNEMPREGLPTVLTVARLSAEKRFDLAIQVHEYLEKQGIHFKWYVVGEGGERENLEKLIKKARLEGKFILLGRRENPYPYIKQTDIFALLSHAEGFGLVITEAKILNKSVLVTDFKASREQIQSGKNGLIVQGTIESVAEGLKKLLLNPELRAKFEKNLEGFEYDNSHSLDQMTQLFTVSP